jgi:transposase
LNNKIRLIIRRAYGFHSAKTAAALVMLCCGPVRVLLPHEK